MYEKPYTFHMWYVENIGNFDDLKLYTNWIYTYVNKSVYDHVRKLYMKIETHGLHVKTLIRK